MIDHTNGNPDGGGSTNSSNGQEFFTHQNRLGSTIATTDSNGNIIDQYTYSPYGVTGTNNSGFPFRFTGQKLDPETGLYYYKARYYDPETGRFLQTDPIGYEDQQNLYAYVGNDPINATDPTGEIGRRRAPGRNRYGRTPREQQRYDELVYWGSQLSILQGHGRGSIAHAPGWTPTQGQINSLRLRVGNVRADLHREITQLRKGVRTKLRNAKEHDRRAAEFERSPTVRPGMEGRTQEEIRAQQKQRAEHLRQEARRFRRQAEEDLLRAERLEGRLREADNLDRN